MKKIIAVSMVLLLLTGCGAHKESAGYRQITQQQAAEIMKEEEDYVILDVRTEEEYASGHIPGAQNLPLAEIGSEAPETLKDKDQKILVYCRSGNRSRQASEKLAALGYTQVLEFGGIQTWKGEIVTETAGGRA